MPHLDSLAHLKHSAKTSALAEVITILLSDNFSAYAN